MNRIIVIILVSGALTANANMTWDWNFASEAGQFITDGNAASPGIYTMLDFSVTASAAGGTIGSLGSGDYLTGTWDTDEPFSFYWDGSQVTDWQHSGANSFNWWTFQDSADSTRSYDFGWGIGNINDPAKGSYYDTDLDEGTALAIGNVTVSPIPEPASGTLLALTGGAIYITRSMRTSLLMKISSRTGLIR